jgi:hypothetical protein
VRISFHLRSDTANVDGWMEVDDHNDLSTLGALIETLSEAVDGNTPGGVKETLAVLDFPSLPTPQPKPAARKRAH